MDLSHKCTQDNLLRLKHNRVSNHISLARCDSVLYNINLIFTYSKTCIRILHNHMAMENGIT